MSIDWQKINAKLPVKKTPEEKELRKTLFRAFDPNGNGLLSLSECQKGVRDVLQLGAMFNAIPAIMPNFT